MPTPKRMLTDAFVFRGDTKSDTDIIYMERLNKTMERILNWYWDAPKEILDVTAGERMIWSDQVLHGSSLVSKKLNWNVTFCDIVKEAKTDVVADCRALPFKDQSQDIIVIDLPFIEYKNALENFNVEKGKANRQFYFRSAKEWIAPETIFKEFWKEANRISRNGLVVKIGERFKDGYEIPVTSYADNYFDQRLNPCSDFKRIKKVGFRGRYSGRGAKMVHMQRVLTFLMLYKKDYKIR